MKQAEFGKRVQMQGGSLHESISSTENGVDGGGVPLPRQGLPITV